MAIIQVNDDWRISSDAHSWNVERRRTRTDKATGELVTEWPAVS